MSRQVRKNSNPRYCHSSLSPNPIHPRGGSITIVTGPPCPDSSSALVGAVADRRNIVRDVLMTAAWNALVQRAAKVGRSLIMSVLLSEPRPKLAHAGNSRAQETDA